MVRSHWKYSVIKGHGILQHIYFFAVSLLESVCTVSTFEAYAATFNQVASHHLAIWVNFHTLPQIMFCVKYCASQTSTHSQDMDSRNLLAMNFECNQLQKQSGYFTFNVIPHFSTTVTKFVLWRTVPCVKTNMNEVFFIQVVLFPAILVYTQIKQSLTEQNHW